MAGLNEVLYQNKWSIQHYIFYKYIYIYIIWPIPEYANKQRVDK